MGNLIDELLSRDVIHAVGIRRNHNLGAFRF